MNDLRNLLIENVKRFHEGVMVRYEDFSSYYSINHYFSFRSAQIGPKKLRMICGMDSIFAHMVKLREESLSIYD